MTKTFMNSRSLPYKKKMKTTPETDYTKSTLPPKFQSCKQKSLSGSGFVE